MKKLIMVIMAFMFSISLLSALTEISDTQLRFKQYDTIDLKIPCYIDGNYCDSSFNCFITSQYPGTGQLFIDHKQMTYNPSYYNYTLNSTAIYGEYPSSISCSNTTISGKIDFIFIINPRGEEITTPYIIVYIFFLLVCIALIIFSFRLTKKNPIEKDLNNSQLYEMKKSHEFKFYVELFKKKMWIVGVFGIYLSILIFSSLLDQLLFSIGTIEIVNLLNPFIQILMWGLIPFVLFWIGYIIIYFWKSSTEIMRYQFGNIGGNR